VIDWIYVLPVVPLTPASAPVGILCANDPVVVTGPPVKPSPALTEVTVPVLVV